MRGSIRPTNVPAPTPLGWWDKELPDVVESEELREQAAVPHERVEWWQERHGRLRLRGRLQVGDLLS